MARLGRSRPAAAYLFVATGPLPGAPVSLTGVTANVAVAEPSDGLVTVSVVGVTATATVAAPAGSVPLALAGAVAGVTVAAPAGSVTVSMVGSTPNVAVAGPAGVVGGGTIVSGVVSNVAVAAPAGSSTVTVNGVVANVTAASSGSVPLSVGGVAAGVAVAAPAGTTAIYGVLGVTATITTAAPPGTLFFETPPGAGRPSKNPAAVPAQAITGYAMPGMPFVQSAQSATYLSLVEANRTGPDISLSTATWGDVISGNTFNNDGNVVLIVHNQSTSTAVQTLEIVVIIDNEPVTAKTVSIPGQAVIAVGPFPVVDYGTSPLILTNSSTLAYIAMRVGPYV
jgi:hypothetical protein